MPNVNASNEMSHAARLYVLNRTTAWLSDKGIASIDDKLAHALAENTTCVQSPTQNRAISGDAPTQLLRIGGNTAAVVVMRIKLRAVLISALAIAGTAVASAPAAIVLTVLQAVLALRDAFNPLGTPDGAIVLALAIAPNHSLTREELLSRMEMSGDTLEAHLATLQSLGILSENDGRVELKERVDFSVSVTTILRY